MKNRQNEKKEIDLLEEGVNSYKRINDYLCRNEVFRIDITDKGC